jgi:glycosyltransferase involved in cell wall biosynthesis
MAAKKKPIKKVDVETTPKPKKLQILVPQYKETKEVLKSLLDSIALQQGIDFNDIGVVIVNDGYPKSKLSDKFLKSYPFKIDYHMAKDHLGVSATRNACLDHATADYVMFCDADDMFFSMVGLNIIFVEMDKGFNSLTTKFYEEVKRDGKFWFTEHK